MAPIDTTSILQFVGALGAGGLTMLIILRLFQDRRQEEAAVNLREELTRRYNEASEEIRQLKAEVNSLWEAQRIDRAYIGELEEYISLSMAAMAEHKVPPVAPRPVRPRWAREGSMTDSEEVKLRKTLTDRLTDDEVEVLAHDLGVHDLRGNTRTGRVLALINTVRTQKLQDALYQWLQDNRNDIKV
jgi:hypothetical protein